MVFSSRWLEVENTGPAEDEFAYVNPNVKLRNEGPVLKDSATLDPETVRERGSSAAEWDVVEETLEAPEAASVESVGIDFNNGLIQVEDSQGSTEYVLGAYGDKGGLQIINENGSVSTSEIQAMATHHHVAVVETIQKQAQVTSEVNEVEMDLSVDNTHVYNDIMSTGSYETLDGDVKFTGFSNTQGVPMLESDEEAASTFLNQMDDIAEFYRDFADDYMPSDEQHEIGIPIKPERKAEGETYKFRLSGTDRDSNIAIEREGYVNDEGALELEVKAFGNHKGNANRF